MAVIAAPQATPQAARPMPQTHTLPCLAGRLVVDVWPAPAEAGTPILLIHGWGGSGSYWRQTAQSLAAQSAVIVPDLPGTGRSQPVVRPQTMYDQVDTLAWMLEALSLPRVQVVGHAMGSAMAILLTAQQPERVTRLVLTSMTFFMTQAQRDFYHRMMDGFRVMMRFRPPWLAQVPGAAYLMAQQYFHRVPHDAVLLQQGLRDYLTIDRATALACADNATDEAIVAAGRRVRVPSLLIAARQDRMMPMENVDYTLDILGDSRVRWIEACGHLPMVEKPEEYLALLREFLIG